MPIQAKNYICIFRCHPVCCRRMRCNNYILCQIIVPIARDCVQRGDSRPRTRVLIFILMVANRSMRRAADTMILVRVLRIRRCDNSLRHIVRSDEFCPMGQNCQRQQRRQENTRYSFHIVPPRRLSAAPPSRPFDAPIIPPSPRILFLNCPKCHSCALKCNSPPKKPFPRRAALSFRGRSAPTAICPLCHSEPVTDVTGVGIRSPPPPPAGAKSPFTQGACCSPGGASRHLPFAALRAAKGAI